MIKVASVSDPRRVAGAIANEIRKTDEAPCVAIGAGAINQTVKAIVIARSYLDEDGIRIVVMMDFVEIDIESHERTGVQFTVKAVS